MKKVAVVAVGGNALTAQGQHGDAHEIEKNAAAMASVISSIVDDGWRVVVVHGNGPQVGNLAIQQEAEVSVAPPQPLYSLNAMTQGQLGSVLVRAINEIQGPGAAVTIVSHMCVNPDDDAFANPTKPIGPFFSAGDVENLECERGWTMVEDSGRGYRRVVPSPKPGDFLESAAVAALLDAGKIVLAAGGGGIAVHRQADGGFLGVDAVIDKDSAATRLASELHAQALLLLTGVDAVAVDFGTPSERTISQMSVHDAAQYLADGQFPPGSMGPKVKAAIDFVHGSSGTAVITSSDLLADALKPANQVGTRIVPSTMMSST